MQQDTPTLEQLVTFCILMENNEGILGKAPSYIFEKYRLAVDLKRPEALLDPGNLAKFNAYMERWSKAWGRRLTALSTEVNVEARKTF